MKNLVSLTIALGFGMQLLMPQFAYSNEAEKAAAAQAKANEHAVEAEKEAAKANRAAAFKHPGFANHEQVKAAEEAAEANKEAAKAEEHAAHSH